MNGKPFRGFESHPLRQQNWSQRTESRRSILRLRQSRLQFVAIMLFMAFATTGVMTSATGQSHAKRSTKGIICGNPQLPCKTSVPFSPYDLPFRVPPRAVIIDTEYFYAIILKSINTTEDDCSVFVPEPERIAAQALFPDRKVFTSRCSDIGADNSGMLYYTNVDWKVRFMAVYGGTTRVAAQRALNAVKASGKFPGAYMKRMQAGFNGT